VEAIELLTLLIERYEEEHYSVPKASPADVLRFLLDRHGMKQRDIAAELGGESVVSEILSGKRRLNAAHIEELSKRFHVSPAVFFAV
jgi:HTH-type transcriptional regulator/antitoxin HigA